MAIGTDQESYLQHLEVCSAREELDDGLQQPEPQTKRGKVNPGMSNGSLSPKKNQLKRKYCCDEPSCEQEFSSNTCLANHKRRLHGVEKLKCSDSECPATFINFKALSRHMWVKHSIGKGPECEKCGK